MWFVEVGANRIGRITTAGIVTEFALPTRGAGPAGVAVGPDGNLWFTEFAADKLGRITTRGAIAEYAMPRRGSGPASIATGADDRLWIAEAGPAGNRIARIAPP